MSSLPDTSTNLDMRSTCETPSNTHILTDLSKYLKHLTPVQAGDVTNIITSHINVFGDHPRKCTLATHDVTLLPGTSPIRQNPYRLHPQKKQHMKKEVDYLLQHDLAVPSQSPWASPCLLVPKEDGQLRLCTDYRRVNAVTIPDAYPLPRIDDLIDEVGQAVYVTKMDLTKGYYQIPLTEEAQLISAFTTPFGLYQYLVLPFGMRNSPATFQRVMNNLLLNLDGVSVYLDDILISSGTWQHHVQQIGAVLSRLQEARMTVKLAKTTFGRATVTYLGHEVGQGRVRPKTANITAILNYPVPTSRKALLRFLGMAGYYRRFCPNFSAAAYPLTHLTSAAVKFEWTEDCQEAFDQLKNFLAQDPVLLTPDFSKPFSLHTDASERACGAVLLQDRDGVLQPVAYHSAKFDTHQSRYSTIEKELLAIVSALKKFECYIQPASHPAHVYTDHNPLSFLNKNKFNNQRLLRWSLFLQPFNLQISHIKGKDNCIADALSRI